MSLNPNTINLNPLGFSPLWFELCSGHMWESQVLLTDGQVVFPQVLQFWPTLINNQLDVREIFLKERVVKPKSKKKRKKEFIQSMVSVNSLPYYPQNLTAK